MLDTSKIRKKLAKRRKEIVSIDAMIDAGHEYVIVDDFEMKVTKNSSKEKPSLVLHDARSGNWFWGAGKDILDYIGEMVKCGADEEEIASTFAAKPELWKLSKVIKVKNYQTNKLQDYRPTEFLGYATEIKQIEKEMEEENGNGFNGIEAGADGSQVAEPAEGKAVNRAVCQSRRSAEGVQDATRC